MSFKLLNSIGVPDGSVVRKITLYEGNLSAIPEEHKVDILIVSAFPNDYTPTPTSLIGALYRNDLSVAKLAKNKAHDLRATSAFWMSHALVESNTEKNIGQVACFEPRVRGAPSAVVGDLFRGLFPFLDHGKCHIVAMPLLASGNQGWPKETMFRSILNAATHWLARGLPIDELKIVEMNPDSARTLSKEMDKFKADLTKSSLALKHSEAYDVFLSFSSKDIKAADYVKTEFKRRLNGVKIFDYRLEIDKGKSWQDEIDKAIGSSRTIVALLSPSYFASPECCEELSQARLRNKKTEKPILFPIYWLDLGKELDLWLQAMNYADCREGSFKNLASAIDKLSMN